MSRIHFGSLFALLALALLLPESAARAEGATPKPLSPAEIAAVNLVVRQFDRGAAAWRGELAPGSPLARLAPAELEARLAIATGPVEGAQWRLATPLAPGSSNEAIFHVEHPSGLDQYLTVRFRPTAGGRLQVEDLHTWADPETSGAPRAALAAHRVRGTDPAGSALRTAGAAEAGGNPVPEPHPERAPAASLAVFALALLGGGFLAWRRGTIPSLLFAGFGSLALAVGSYATVHALWDRGAVSGPALAAAVEPAHGSEDDSWSRVARLHTELSASGDSAAAEAFLHSVRPGSPAWTRVALDLVQAQMQAGRLDFAERTLQEIDALPKRPALAGILRARIALQRGKAGAAALEYRQADSSLVDCDALAFERLDALIDLGSESEAQALLERIVEGGSREAAAHYLLARLFVARDDNERALASFRTAWSLAPLQRSEAIGDPALAFLLRQGNLLGGLELATANEPRPAVLPAGGRPLALPPGFTISASGRELRVEGRGATLSIPGGAELAPPDTPQEDAVSRDQRQENDVLAHLDALEGLVASPARASQPALRRRLEIATNALARQNRWPVILELTDALGDQPQNLPSTAVELRAEALYRERRGPEAARLLVAYASQGGTENRSDPNLFFHLGHLLLKLDQYDLAARAIQKAEALSPFPPISSEVAKIRMDQNLATAYASIATTHFVVRYPKELSSPYFDQLGAVFEQEYARLKRWIPGSLDRPVEVNLYPFQQFVQIYSQGEFIGLFDGKVRLPFADIQTLHPQAVSVMSHEIGHALLAEATHDFAPHWFQEGLAQHLQPVQDQVNPLPDYEQKGVLLSIRMLEVPLSTPSDP
ncbi:MAG TPA: hypothetical protein VN783_05070, partial [Thermoanaerobaculia bacterium]|nr:hypothetical protein [Thermoanaerobaculia bacterium]